MEAVSSLAHTWVVSLVGLTIGATIGYVVGMFVTVLGLRPVYPLLSGLKAVPVTALLPLFMIVFGLQNMLIPMVALPVLAVVAVNVAEAGFRARNRRDHVKRAIGLTEVQFVRHVLFWETLEVSFASIRSMIPHAIALTVALDYFLGILGAAGRSLEQYYNNYDYQMMVFYALALAGMSALSIFLLDQAATRMLRWTTR